jgi:hypothetical protein
MGREELPAAAAVKIVQYHPLAGSRFERTAKLARKGLCDAPFRVAPLGNVIQGLCVEHWSNPATPV